MGWDTPLPVGTAGAVERHLSPARLSTYLTATGGDLDAAVDLYRWNAAVSAALWESIGHTEVVLRNATHDALSARHAAKGRQGQWYDDPARELDQHARDDVGKAIRRIKAGASPPEGKVVAELSFGFWRFLLAKRYTAGLWPALRPAFPFLASSDRLQLEAPVERVHKLRNRVAHHEPVIAQDLASLHVDVLALAVALILTIKLVKWAKRWTD
jgi:hypothetical protein